MKRVFLLALVVSMSTYAVAQRDKDQAARQRFVQTVLQAFSTWDLNHDGQLDEGELTAIVQDPQVTGEYAAAAAAMKTSLVSEKAPSFPQLTLEYFRSDDPSLKYLTTAFKSCEKRLQKSAEQPVFQKEGPTLTGCKQGALGDCYLVAAVGAIVARDPSAICRILSTAADSEGYRVSFPDGMKVDAPPLTQGELAMGGAGTANGLWLRLIEKAYGIRRILSNKKYSLGADPHDVLSGGSGRFALEVMTGFEAKQYHLGAHNKGPIATVPEIRKALTDAINAHHVAIAGTNKEVHVPGISKGHCYAILGFDSQSDTVQIWNPHVNKFTPKGPEGPEFGYTTLEGRFTMPLAEFQQTFNGLAIQTDVPMKTPSKP